MGDAAKGHSRGRPWLAVVAIASILGWAVPALVMLGKGFAIADEGTYVLSYRFWHANPYFVSGAQFIYGPVFEALGESIPHLRMLRLVMVLATNAWFAWCFVQWLRYQAPSRMPDSGSRLILLLTASGGMAYLWTPLTPGYYDLTADASLALVSLLLLTLTRGRRSWVALASGVAAVVLLITKWTAFPVALLAIGLAIWALSRTSRADAVHHAVLVFLGSIAALLAFQLWFAPVAWYASILWRVSSLTAVGSHGFVYLARANVVTTAQLLIGSSLAALPLAVALLMGRATASRGRDTASRRWLLAGALCATIVFPLAVGWRGGSGQGRAVVCVAFGALLVALLAGATLPSGTLPGGSLGRLLVLVLVMVPFFQAAGTNVPILYVAFECVAMWVAVALLLAAREHSSTFASTAILVDLAVLVVATAMIAGSTTLLTPFKTASVSEATTLVPQLGVGLDPATARQYEALATALRPYVVAGRTPIITLDQLSGLAYVLGGVPAGSTWTDGASPSRTAGIFSLACEHGDVTSAPVLVLNRPVDPALQRAMAQCGFDYPAGYRPLEVPSGPPGLQVLVPRAGS